MSAPEPEPGKKKEEEEDEEEEMGAEAEEEEEEEEDDEENDDDIPDEYEADGFIVDEVEDDEGVVEDGGDQRPKKKRRRHHDREDKYQLEEADIDLIRQSHPELLHKIDSSLSGAGNGGGGGDNGGTGAGGEKRLRRLKKAAVHKSSAEVRQELQAKLFGADPTAAAEPSDVLPAPNPTAEDVVGSLSEEDGEGMDDFIVDEQDRPIRRAARRSSRADHAMSTLLGGGGADEDYDEEDEDAEADADAEAAQPIDKAAALRAAYEPADLEKRFLSPEDDAVRAADRPERYQLRFSRVPGAAAVLSSLDTAREADWIYRRAFDVALGGIAIAGEPDRASAVAKIAVALDYIHKDELEVPFIRTYRTDYVGVGLCDHLWEVYDLDEQYIRMLASKSALTKSLASYVPNAAAGDGAKSDSAMAAYCKEALAAAETEMELQDVSDFMLLYGLNGEANANAGGAAALRRDTYSEYQRMGLAGFAAKVGLSARQLADNIELRSMKHTPVDPPEMPEVLAAAYAASLQSPAAASLAPEAVLKGARHMLAREIATDPRIRQWLRVVFEAGASVNTSPKPSRSREIDVRHIYAKVKRIRGKNVSDFRTGSSFALISQAEQEGFITAEVAVPPELHASKFVPTLSPLYVGVGTSAVATAWNEQRTAIIEEALTEHLYPLFAQQTRARLLDEAANHAISAAASELASRLNVAPWAGTVGDRRRPGTARVAAFALADAPEASSVPTVVCVIVDQNGEPAESLKLEWITMPVRTAGKDAPPIPPDPRLEDDTRKLTAFLAKAAPDVIVISASSIAAIRLQKVMKSIDRRYDINLAIVVDPTVPKIFANSERAQSEMPQRSALFREAVSAGRMLQDPLSELCGLCGNGSHRDLLCLGLHPQSGYLARIRESRYSEVLIRKCIDAVSQTGVDVNMAANFRHAAPMLQFVPGLGPRKAGVLTSAVFARGGVLSSRKQLDEIFGAVVVRNCAAFLRIKAKYLKENDEHDPLDDTRVHPETYAFARKLAADALDRPMTDKNVIRDILRSIGSRQGIDEIVDVDNFARGVDEKSKGKHIESFRFIARELDGPFAERRQDFLVISHDLLLELVIGQKLQAGDPVPMHITSAGPKAVYGTICKGLVRAELEGGLDSLPQGMRDGDPKGTTLMCFVQSVNAAEMSAVVTRTRNDAAIISELREEEPCLVLESEETERESEAAAAAAAIGATAQVYSRAVKHPLFKNATPKEAADWLQAQPVGSVIIRPSTRDEATLSLHWKMTADVSVMLNIQEKKKANILTLGKELHLGKEKFEDLDELHARFVEPLNGYVAEATSNRKWFGGSRAEAVEELKKEKSSCPNRIAYLVSASREHPGKLLLSYMPHSNAKHEYITVSPDGFRFRSKDFAKLDHVIKWFKVHWKEPIPQKQPQPAQAQGTAWEEQPDYHVTVPSDSGWGVTAAAPAASSWGAPAPAPAPASDSGWGSSAPATTSDSGWGSAAPTSSTDGGWGAQTSGSSGWGASSGGSDAWGSSSGSAPPPSSSRGGSSGRGCYTCGQEGHLSRDCPQKRGGGGGGSSGSGCYNCGKPGHLSRDCTEPRKPSGRGGGGSRGACYKCGKEGHMSRDCPGSGAPSSSSFGAPGSGGWGDQPNSGSGW